MGSVQCAVGAIMAGWLAGSNDQDLRAVTGDDATQSSVDERGFIMINERMIKNVAVIIPLLVCFVHVSACSAFLCSFFGRIP